MEYNQTLYGALHDTYQRYPERNALLFMGKYLTYDQFVTKVDALSAGFTEIGINSGDVVTLAMPNVFEALFSFYALNRIGVICHMVLPLTPAVQMSRFMKQTGSKHLIIIDTFYNQFKTLLEEGDKTFILANPVTEFGFVKNTGYKVINSKRLKGIKYGQKILKLKDLYSRNSIDVPDINPKKTAFLLHSGGTSGEPKTIELSNYAINFLASKLPYIMDLDILKDVHMLAVLPMFHGFGLCMGIHAMLMAGGVDTLMPKFDADEAVKLIALNRCNVIIGVPSLFESLLRHEEFKTKKVGNILQAYVGGDYVAQDLKNRFNEVMEYYYSNARLLEGYGLTEVVTVSCVNTLKENTEGTVGKPLPDIEMRIYDSQNNTFMAVDQAGEILVSGPTMMNGYLNDKEATKNTIIKLDGKKWVRTGDFGFIDANGYVHFKQRLKRIIKVSGMPVLPAEIENFLMSQPAVKEVCAVGISDVLLGSKVKLFIAFNKGLEPLSEDKIKTMIKDNISRYAEPDKIVVMDELPKTIIGKINVLELEKM